MALPTARIGGRTGLPRGMNGARAVGVAQALALWQSRWRSIVRAGREQAVGAPQHGILLVDQSRQPELRGGEHGRHRGVAAELDDHRRRQLGATEAAPEQCRLPARRARMRRCSGPPPNLSGARTLVGRHARHGLGKGVGASVGQEVHRWPPRSTRSRATASAGKKCPPSRRRRGHRPGSQLVSRPGCRRVSASSIPMPSASAIIDEVP